MCCAFAVSPQLPHLHKVVNTEIVYNYCTIIVLLTYCIVIVCNSSVSPQLPHLNKVVNTVILVNTSVLSHNKAEIARKIKKRYIVRKIG